MSINKNQDDKYFRTSNFYIASFLFANGLELINIDDTSNPKRKEFVFRDSPERETLLHNYNYSPEDSQGVKVDARKLIMAIKMLKDKLHQ